nr:class E sortase [Cellulomonas sp. APG4]
MTVLGELLVTLGVLVALFVVWQLWWTDVEAGREQRAVVEDLDWAVDTDDVPLPEAASEPTTPSDPPVLDEPAHATTFATLRVPRWGSDYVRPVSQGTSRPDVLDVLGIGHYEGTAMPGEVGNFALAAHRTTYAKPFHLVEDLQVGDPLVVQTPEAWFVYRVTETRVVLPRDVEVIAPVPGDPGAEPTTAMMTLTTCHPMFSARERFIVHAELDTWQPVSEGLPEALGEVPAEAGAGTDVEAPTGTGGA